MNFPKKTAVYIRRSWMDVKMLRDGWDDEKCLDVFDKIQIHLRARMHRHGWEVLDELISKEEVK